MIAGQAVHHACFGASSIPTPSCCRSNVPQKTWSIVYTVVSCEEEFYFFPSHLRGPPCPPCSWSLAPRVRRPRQIPVLPRPPAGADVMVSRLPNILGVKTEAFDPDTYDEEAVRVLRSLCVSLILILVCVEVLITGRSLT